MEIAIAIAAVLLLTPVLIKRLLGLITKTVVTSAEIKKYKCSLQTIKKNEGLRKTYRKYAFIDALLQIFIFPMTFALYPPTHFFSESTGAAASPAFVISIFIFIPLAIGPAVLTSRMVVITLRKIFSHKTDFSHYDVFISLSNTQFENIEPLAKKLASAKSVNLMTKFVYIAATIYLFLFAMLTILENLGLLDNLKHR